MSEVARGQDNHGPVMWVAVGLAWFVALSYLMIQMQVLGVGDLQAAEGSAAIVYVAAGCYFVGGLLILLQRRGLLIFGAVMNALVMLFFFMAYAQRASVMLSTGGLATKAAQLLLEVALLYMIFASPRQVIGRVAHGHR